MSATARPLRIGEPPVGAAHAGEARIGPKAQAAIRAAIRLAGNREVCFVGTVDEEGIVESVRVASRGDINSVLAMPGVAEVGQMLIHNHPSGLLEPSGPDLDIAAGFHGNGVGFAICDNDASRLYVVVEVPKKRIYSDMDAAGIDADLGPGGPIAARHARYEDRPSQRAMATEIARLYNEGGIGLLEAGTGVGKSLGYLIPALRWAAMNKERTVVSTNTINLQEQLVGKDLPFLDGALTDQPVRFALLKGWRNYLCLQRLENALGSGAALFDDGMARELEALDAWAEHTTDGSVQDLAVAPRSEVWDEVAAEPDLCQRMKCPHFDRCFLFTARKKAATADVIVVNHHLLMSDLAVRRASQNWEDAAVLPSYKRLVIDEGHHLEDAAGAHLGSTVTRRGLIRLFNRLDRRGGKGLLNALLQKLGASNDLLSVASLDLVYAKLAPAVQAARDKASHVFDLLDVVMQDATEPTMRLTDAFDDHIVWKMGLHAALDDLLGEFELLAQGLRMVRERLESDAKKEEEFAALIGEMRGVTKRLQGAGDALRGTLIPEREKEPVVRWIEVRGKDRSVAVSAVPLDLAPILREDLFRKLKTAVVTSATLAANGRFDFLSNRLGLDDDELTPSTGLYPSPFDYPRQAVLAIPTDVPAPNVDGEGHFAAVMRALFALSEASDGGIFALFTSHRDVKRAASEMRARGADRRWPLLVHGEESRDALLNRFRDASRAVLIGTASFWEGVDVPGDALRGLLIGKLPFRVPSEPMTAAQCEAIEERGGDSFREYMLPHAGLRLKQGFGRLIRSATDRGVVVLMDPRVATKAYGRDLLRGLPDARRVVGAWADVEREITAFYELYAR